MEFSNIISVLNFVLYVVIGIAGAIMGAVLTVKGMQSKLENLSKDFVELTEENKSLKQKQQHFADNFVKNDQMEKYIHLILQPIIKDISLINKSHGEHKEMLNKIITMLVRIEQKSV